MTNIVIILSVEKIKRCLKKYKLQNDLDFTTDKL